MLQGTIEDAVSRGVALLERFYTYGKCRRKDHRKGNNLRTFYSNGKHVETVNSVLEDIFKASEYDVLVAARHTDNNFSESSPCECRSCNVSVHCLRKPL